MRPSLDHELSSAAVQFRRSEFLTYILETKVPGLHFDDDDGEERLPKSTMPTHMLPRIVDGARETHMIAGHLQNEGGRDSDNAVMKILEEQDSKGDPFPVSEEDLKFTGGEPGDVVSDGISQSQCLQFLRNRGQHFLMKNFKDKETVCSVLLDMAEHVKVLPPGNEPLPWDVLNMTLEGFLVRAPERNEDRGREVFFPSGDLRSVCAHHIAILCVSASVVCRDC